MSRPRIVPNMSHALIVDDVSKTFRQRPLLRRRSEHVVSALDDVSFAVRRGEIFGILGANGSGKSTLIRVISTLLTPDRGSVSVFGWDTQQDEVEVKRLISRVSVEAAFFKKLSAMENLLYSSRLYGRGGPELRSEIVEILVNLGIGEDRIGQPLEQLSRGMQQKVAIARAFLTSPVLLLLDEPTTGLDPRSKLDVQVLVRQLRDEHDATIVLCSHDLDEAERLCDRIAVIDQGRVVAIDTVEGLKQQVRCASGVLDVSLEDVFFNLTGRSLAAEQSGDPVGVA